MKFNSPPPIVQARSSTWLVITSGISFIFYCIKTLIYHFGNLGGNEGSGLFGSDFLVYALFSLSFYLCSLLMPLIGLVILIGELRKEDNGKAGYFLLMALIHLLIVGFAFYTFYK